MEKHKKYCSSCETKYTIIWNVDEQDLEPLTCPFCGYEVDDEDDGQERVHDHEGWN